MNEIEPPYSASTRKGEVSRKVHVISKPQNVFSVPQKQQQQQQQKLSSFIIYYHPSS